MERHLKHNERDRNTERKGNRDTMRLASLVKQSGKSLNKKLHQNLIKYHTMLEIKMSCFGLKHI